MMAKSDVSTPAPLPIEAEEARRLLAPLAGVSRLGIAVSGGADSLALMHLVARWAREDDARPDCHVLTVDHGLRAEAASEARRVKTWAAGAGLDHSVLTADQAPPVGGLMQWARDLRLRLMSRWVRKHGADGLVLGHHLEDQGETLAMRLARGSGLRGLSAMSGEAMVGNLRLYRPLLGVSRSRLRATLVAMGQDWIEDPSNHDRRFERVRVRQAMAPGGQLAELGLGPAALAAAATRLGRADAAIDHFVTRSFEHSVVLDKAGYAMIDGEAFDAEPEEIRLRLLARLVAWTGGRTLPRGAGLEVLLGDLDRGVTAATLGGCRVARGKTGLLVTRELRGIKPCRLEAGQSVRWDRRFCIRFDGAGEPVDIRPLGVEGFSHVKSVCPGLSGVPFRAGHGLPGGFRGSTLALLPAFSSQNGVPVGGGGDTDCLRLEICSRF